MIKSNQVTIGITPTLIWTAIGKTELVLGSSSGSIFLGDSTITLLTGSRLFAGVPITVNLSDGDSLYGIVAAGTSVVTILAST